MDFEEMRGAVDRAMAQTTVNTRATGSHIPTVVIDPTQTQVHRTFATDVVQRLLDHYEVTKDALSREAALTLKYETQQLQLNLSRLEGAIKILGDLYESVNELGEYSRNWPWEARGNGVDQKLNSALDACQGFMKACWPWTA